MTYVCTESSLLLCKLIKRLQEMASAFTLKLTDSFTLAVSALHRSVESGDLVGHVESLYIVGHGVIAGCKQRKRLLPSALFAGKADPR
jgi:hypothetical protein